MDFGVVSMFSAREGCTQSQTFNEWFGLVRLAEDSGLDTFWFGESHFRPHRAVMASPLIGASAAVLSDPATELRHHDERHLSELRLHVCVERGETL